MFVSDGFEDVSESKLLAWRIFSCVGVDFLYGSRSSDCHLQRFSWLFISMFISHREVRVLE